MMSQFEPEEIQLERERAILEEIRNNPKSHHNALVKKIVPKHMAKATFEKTRDELIEKNIITFTTKGNRKFYQITERYEQKAIQIIERITISNFQFLKHEIKRINEKSYHNDVNEKILSVSSILRKLLQTDQGFTFLDSIKNSKKTLYKDEHLEIQEMIYFVFHSITKEKESQIILPTVLSCIGFDFSKSYAQ